MPVITISREFGSVGDDFGGEIALALGYHCLCKEEIGDLLAQYGMVEFGREYESRPSFWESFRTGREQRRSEMVGMLNAVVRAVAHHGNTVIQGRSGYAILQGFADVLHVRMQAPLAVRVTRVMEEQRLPAQEAAATVKERDRVRKAFVEDFYGVPWAADKAFDLVIDTGKIASEMAVTWVVSATKAPALDHANAVRTTRSIEVDSVLAKAVCDLLHCASAHA